jgi:hypothetical protein
MAIADGTDTPSLRRALLSLESEKVELAMAMYHRPAFVEPPPVPDLEKLFRRKVEMLEQRLGDDPTITTQAATILRALIEGIVLHPRKRATMSIEVYGEPSALFLLDNDEASDGRDRMLTVVAEDL